MCFPNINRCFGINVSWICLRREICKVISDYRHWINWKNLQIGFFTMEKCMFANEEKVSHLYIDKITEYYAIS